MRLVLMAGFALSSALVFTNIAQAEIHMTSSKRVDEKAATKEGDATAEKAKEGDATAEKAKEGDATAEKAAEPAKEAEPADKKKESEAAQ